MKTPVIRFVVVLWVISMLVGLPFSAGYSVGRTSTWIWLLLLFLSIVAAFLAVTVSIPVEGHGRPWEKTRVALPSGTYRIIHADTGTYRERHWYRGWAKHLESGIWFPFWVYEDPRLCVSGFRVEGKTLLLW